MNTHLRRRSAAFALGVVALSTASIIAQTEEFRITNFGCSNGVAALQWRSAAGWNYTVQRSTSLVPDSWANVLPFVDVAGQDGFLAATDTLQSASNVFYRVERYRPPYRHTIAIDGVNDFTSVETFGTSSAFYGAFITWDSTYLYLGVQGPDIGGSSASKYLLVYLSGSPGTMTGIQYNTQGPQLPFSAKYHLRWRTDGNSSGLVFNGSAWVNMSPGSEGSWYRSGSFVEWRIPLATVGNPAQFDMHVSMLSELSGSEWSYAAVPHNSFADGYDPDYSEYFHFDMGSPSVPNAAAPLP